MGLEERVLEVQNNEDRTDQTWRLCAHAFYDLTHVSPVVFLYLLKECYIHGTLKATKKFRALQQQVHHALCNSPQPGPTTFVIWCLYTLPIFGDHCEGLSHLVLSALRRFLKRETNSEDTWKAKVLAARLFLDTVVGSVDHNEKIIVRILEVAGVRLTDIDKSMCHLKAQNDYIYDTAKSFVEDYIFHLIESESYMMAVTLLEHFSIRQSGQPFLLKMLENTQYKAAEKWATFMGKPMLCILVQEYADRNMLQQAYETIKKNNLRQEFPDVYHQCKESSLKKLAEKALWDLAEEKTHGNKQLIEYLVYLAMEAGYSEKVDELCDRYSLEGFVKSKVPVESLVHGRYLDLKELAVEDIVWVDEVEGLHNATCHIENCKVVGIDCEWKPNYEKGSTPNKVSIMQIASEKMVFIFDLIKLFEDVPDTLDNCLTGILQSSGILKLGYNFQCDFDQLTRSYGELKCFKHYEMLLDIQNVYREPRGGLSGLAKKILGVGLNKTRRNSNWEQRPLSRHQLEYAALDAAVLTHIFRHVGNHSQLAGVSDYHEKHEWKSYIVPYLQNPRRTKKESRISQ